MPPVSPVNPLSKRLYRLRRRLRRIALVRGVSCLVLAGISIIVAVGALDWLLHLPGLVRAVFLSALLACIGVIVHRFLIQPLRQPSDDLSLALKVESEYPELNDCLASTVQFLEQGPQAGQGDSATLRRAAVTQTLSKTRECDFNRIVDSRGVRVAGFFMVLAAILAGALVLWQPEAAATALNRKSTRLNSSHIQKSRMPSSA